MIASGRAHFTFNTTFSSGQTVNSQGGPETHTVYNTEGDVVARVKFVGFTHVTYRDANGNGQPEDGEITASMDHLKVICLGIRVLASTDLTSAREPDSAKLSNAALTSPAGRTTSRMRRAYPSSVPTVWSARCLRTVGPDSRSAGSRSGR